MLLLIILMVFIVWFKFTANKGQRKQYETIAMDFASNYDWVSFEIEHKHYKDDIKLWEGHNRVVLHYDGDNSIIFGETLSEDEERIIKSCYLDKNNYLEINHDSQEITWYDNNKVFWDDYHSYGIAQFIPNVFYFFSYYLYPMQKTMCRGLLNYLVVDVTGCENITIKGKPYFNFHGVSNTAYSYNPKTGERMPVYDVVDWFVDERIGTMDSVCAVRYPLEYENRKDYVCLRNMSFLNRQWYLDSILDFNNNPRYIEYIRHNSKNPPLSNSYSNNKTITNDLLNYPLVDLEGSKTVIAEIEGWILLNFWSANCSPCVAHLKELGHEKDSLGHYWLENKGVKIMAINHLSNNAELIASITEKTGTSDITYMANGMGGVINIPSLGYYYLISPDKQIVYETYNLGDYSELLRAISNFEKCQKISKP